MGDTRNHFTELVTALRDYTKSWDVDLTEVIDSYIQKIFNGDITRSEDIQLMDFVEAAHLLQYSTELYSRKVELFFQFAFELLQKLRVNANEAEPVKVRNVSKRRSTARQSLDIESLENFSPSVCEKKMDSKGSINFLHPKLQYAATSLSGSEKKFVVLDARDDVIPNDGDFRMNANIDVNIYLGDDHCMALPLKQFDDSNSDELVDDPDTTEETTMLCEETNDEDSAADLTNTTHCSLTGLDASSVASPCKETDTSEYNNNSVTSSANIDATEYNNNSVTSSTNIDATEYNNNSVTSSTNIDATLVDTVSSQTSFTKDTEAETESSRQEDDTLALHSITKAEKDMSPSISESRTDVVQSPLPNEIENVMELDTAPHSTPIKPVSQPTNNNTTSIAENEPLSGAQDECPEDNIPASSDKKSKNSEAKNNSKKELLGISGYISDIYLPIPVDSLVADRILRRRSDPYSLHCRLCICNNGHSVRKSEKPRATVVINLRMLLFLLLGSITRGCIVEQFPYFDFMVIDEKLGNQKIFLDPLAPPKNAGKRGRRPTVEPDIAEFHGYIEKYTSEIDLFCEAFPYAHRITILNDDYSSESDSEDDIAEQYCPGSVSDNHAGQAVVECSQRKGVEHCDYDDDNAEISGNETVNQIEDIVSQAQNQESVVIDGVRQEEETKEFENVEVDASDNVEPLISAADTNVTKISPDKDNPEDSCSVENVIDTPESNHLSEVQPESQSLIEANSVADVENFAKKKTVTFDADVTEILPQEFISNAINIFGTEEDYDIEKEDMEKRVSDWHSLIEVPLLHAEARRNIDIGEYCDEVLNSFTPPQKTEITFYDFMAKRKEEDGPRYLNSVLVLANQYRVHISKSTSEELSMDNVVLKYLKSQCDNSTPEDYEGLSSTSLKSKNRSASKNLDTPTKKFKQASCQSKKVIFSKSKECNALESQGVKSQNKRPAPVVIHSPAKQARVNGANSIEHYESAMAASVQSSSALNASSLNSRRTFSGTNKNVRSMSYSQPGGSWQASTRSSSPQAGSSSENH